jgi:hypothetical protein
MDYWGKDWGKDVREKAIKIGLGLVALVLILLITLHFVSGYNVFE